MTRPQFRLKTIHASAYLLRPEDNSWCRKFPSVAQAVTFLRRQRSAVGATLRVFAIDDHPTELICVG